MLIFIHQNHQAVIFQQPQQLRSEPMFYHEYPPPPSLQPYIQCFWMLEHDYRESFHTHEHLWADVHTEYIFSFGERYYQKIAGKRYPLPQNFIIGPQTKQLSLYSNGITGLIAARFNPGGFPAFSAQTATDLVDQIRAGDNTLGHQLDGQNREAKLTLLTTHFNTRLPSPNPDREKIVALARVLQSDHGKPKIVDLAKKFDINPRKLQRHFLQYIGLPAKHFARILRFNQARELLQSNPDIGLAALAYETGFTDQAHFSKNFKQLFDLTPAQFKARIKKYITDTAGLDPHVVFVQDWPKDTSYLRSINNKRS
jgi:AraC-like DNA-binding protein